ncbi:gephyrin-like molybdotransferase Glp [Leptolyngbya sp. FACHB-261]|uniref:molybdopterin molybdotransferase MoeA n=1 Tax=Leptolyngbya sp. FACHB-261 TaxID=2692806 RepID=UPI00168999DC|nr:gephyrin-like molybdotransferase Glp [Leptolyngbya sp. FACHB-261]MBD2103715.1 molybdopterin molybdotransferase MoeA [Leptolyngbya sp. FACHB-261]
MLSVAQAEALVLELVRPPDPNSAAAIETVPLEAALGRVLALPVQANLDFPHWDNSSMDGYAVRYADIKGSSDERPVQLALVEEIPAGTAPQKTVGPGQTARILTGSMLPSGADTVVMQENTQRQGDQVSILKPAQLGQNIRKQAAFYRAGARLLEAGTELAGPELAALAAARCTPVSVYRRLRVAVFSTGDELVALQELPQEQPLLPGQIIDSNYLGLVALVQQLGAEPLSLGIVRDDPTALKTTMLQALASADVVISSGGVSVGDYDYVDQMLTDLGATLHIRAVAIKPGKPLTVATVERPEGRKLYFGLPGNPVSSMVSFWRFVQPALRKLSGRLGPWQPQFVQAIATTQLKAAGQRESYLWGKLSPNQGNLQFAPLGSSHNSGDLISLAGANALAVLSVGQTVEAGEPVSVMLLREW